MNIIEEFKKANPVNLKQIELLNYKKKARITRSGRLFDVTDRNDDYLLIKIATLKNGKKIVSVERADKNTDLVVKSSTASTGAPFIDVRKLCINWFGNNPDSWAKKLKLLEAGAKIDYYEVMEKMEENVHALR